MKMVKNLKKLFLNLEKARATKSTIKMLENNGEETIDQNLINKSLENFYIILFQKTIQNNDDKLNNILNEVSVSRLSNKQQNMCENEISEK